MSHHHHSDYVKVVSEKGPQKLSSKMRSIFVAMTIVGLLALLVLLLAPASITGGKRSFWIALLHNLYYFTGLSAGGMAVAGIMHVARSMWGRPIKRFAEAMSAFLPVTVIGLIVFWVGANMVKPAFTETVDEHGKSHREWAFGTPEYEQIKGSFADPNEFIWEWVSMPPDPGHFANKAIWLTPNFVFGRDILAILLLMFIAWKFRKHSERPDFALANKHNSAWPAPAGYGNHEEEVERSKNRQTFWGVILCFAFAVSFSVLAYDLIMSLDYRWVSTMFGGWNFTTALLQSWGMLVFITWWLSGRFGLEKYIHQKLYHDLGKLTFGFTIVWGYLFFAQVNVIWYGNLPAETGYLITRFHPTEGSWSNLGIPVFCAVWLLPFLLGLSKKRKMTPATFAPVVILSAVGIWFERLLLIAPSSWYYDRATDTFKGGFGVFMFFDVLVMIGFIGLFSLLFVNHLYKRPLMVISDPRLDEGINRH